MELAESLTVGTAGNWERANSQAVAADGEARRRYAEAAALDEAASGCSSKSEVQASTLDKLKNWAKMP